MTVISNSILDKIRAWAMLNVMTVSTSTSTNHAKKKIIIRILGNITVKNSLSFESKKKKFEFSTIKQ